MKECLKWKTDKACVQGCKRAHVAISPDIFISGSSILIPRWQVSNSKAWGYYLLCFMDQAQGWYNSKSNSQTGHSTTVIHSQAVIPTLTPQALPFFLSKYIMGPNMSAVKGTNYGGLSESLR